MKPSLPLALLLSLGCSTQAIVDGRAGGQDVVEGAVVSPSDVSLLAYHPDPDGGAPSTRVLIGLFEENDVGPDDKTVNSSLLDTFTSRDTSLRPAFKSAFRYYQRGAHLPRPDGGVVTDAHPNCPVVSSPTLIVNGYAKPYEFAQSEFLAWLSVNTGRSDFLPTRARSANPWRGNQACPLAQTESLSRTFGQRIIADATSVTLSTDNTLNPWRWAAPVLEVHHHEQPSLYATFPLRDGTAVAETKSILAAALAGDLSRRIILDYDLDVSVQDAGLGTEPDLFSILDGPTPGAIDLFGAQYANTVSAWGAGTGPRVYLDKRVVPPSFQLSVGVNFRENAAGYRLSEFQLLGFRYEPALVWDLPANTVINYFMTEGGGQGSSAWTRVKTDAFQLAPLVADGIIVRSGGTYTELTGPDFTGRLKGQLDITNYYRIAHGHQFFPGLIDPKDGGVARDPTTPENEIPWAGVIYEAHGPLKVTVRILSFNLRVERATAGVCGTSVNSCLVGTSVDVADTTTTSLWSCVGVAGGATTSCSMPKAINGACGSAVNTCSSGSFADRPDTATASLWNCVGSSGGTTAACSRPKAINGMCGSTVNTCSSGSFADRPDTATASLWSCIGSSGGTTASCSLVKTLTWNSVTRTNNGVDHDIGYPGYSAPGFVVEGVVFRVATTQGSGMHALYNCLIGTNHFVSPTSTCEGQQVVSAGPFGFVYSAGGAGRAPVYRCAVGGDHYVSTSSTCEVGVAAEGVLGYFE